MSDKLTEQDIVDIAEHIIHRIEDYSEGYKLSEGILTFDDYILVRVSTELQTRFHRVVVQEAFDDYRIKTIIDFYTTGEEDESEIKIH